MQNLFYFGPCMNKIHLNVQTMKKKLAQHFYY
jgi:hypothetical protein